MSGPKRIPLEQRFWSKVDRRAQDECWPWLGTKNSKGYGVISAPGRRTGQLYAHRLAYEFLIGPLGDQFACHKCDNPGCVNPYHIFPGDHAANAQDASRKGIAPMGETSGMSKLTENQVRAIRHQFRSGINQSQRGNVIELTRKYNVSKSTINRIVRRIAWKHVNGGVS